MQPVIYPVSKEKLLAELTKDKLVRKTNKAENEIYSFNAFNAPNLMREVGRLRELTFRTAGGGTGKEVDIDEWDGGILGVSDIGRPEHMPAETVVPGPRLRSELNGW